MRKIKISFLILTFLLEGIIFVLRFTTNAVKIAQASDADLKAGPYGPDISVGIKEYSKSYRKEHSFKISANKKFNLKDREGNIISTVDANTNLKIRYDGDKYFWIYNSNPKIRIYRQITFDAADNDNYDLIFDINLPDYSYDQYRGKIRLRYAEIEDETDKIWVINIVPLEQYVWGMGEMTGTGPSEHNKVMTTIFRTYGYWKIKYSTKWAYLGFKVNATAGDQIYKGYEWEQDHPNIREAAEATKGKIVMYKNSIALTAYSSWNDGKTRRYEDGHWGKKCRKIKGTKSKIYPYLNLIKDPHGKHPSKSTCALAKEGNHMVGLTANGSLDLAKNHHWDYGKILKYYYSGVSIFKAYQ